VHQRAVAGEVHHPELADTRPRIELQLRPEIELQARVGDLDHQIDIGRPWVGGGPWVGVGVTVPGLAQQGEVRLGFRGIVEHDRALHAYRSPARGRQDQQFGQCIDRERMACRCPIDTNRPKD
jgi:hypothetical protein